MDPKELERAERHYTALAEEAKAFVERREGATLRDEFAMRAMQGILAMAPTFTSPGGSQTAFDAGNPEHVRALLKISYEIADEAMIARRV